MLKTVNIEKHWLFGDSYRETNCTFNEPNLNKRYVKILALCLAPQPAKVIYPNVEHPVMHQVRDMCREGLLERLTDGKRYYYKTTTKGRELISKAWEAKQYVNCNIGNDRVLVLRLTTRTSNSHDNIRIVTLHIQNHRNLREGIPEAKRTEENWKRVARPIYKII